MRTTITDEGLEIDDLSTVVAGQLPAVEEIASVEPTVGMDKEPTIPADIPLSVRELLNKLGQLLRRHLHQRKD